MMMAFVYPAFQISPFFVAMLMVLTLMTLPLTPLRAESNQSKKQARSQEYSPTTLPKGIYLYGESPQPYQIGNEYILLDMNEDPLVGVIYMPHSSFSCFQGTIAGENLEMTVDHPYKETTYSYELSLSFSSIASQQNELELPFDIHGYHPLNEISKNDRRMLETCRNEQ